MSDTKIFSFGDQSGLGGGGMASLIASLCQNRGLDPNMVAAMMNNNRGNGAFGDMGAWWIVILLIFGWGGFGNGFGGGFGGRGSAQGLADLGNLVNSDAGRELIMQAIQGNATAISQLASTVHCDQNALQGAIQSLSTQMCQLGNTLGLGQRDIIAAMENGNTSIMSKLCDCCCENRLAIANQTNTLQGAINFVNSSVERGFAATNYAFADQTCQLKNEINALKQYVGDQFCQDRMDQMRRENQNLRDQVQAFQLSASQQQQTANLVAQLRPCPSPAYVVPNPFGCGCNNYGYPFNGNNCGGCNNGCGC
ncbi:MAG: hypothetical protein K2H16_06100 [Prevotella sp.]|nr:hypothetical protein [Prevotella sp.]